MARSSLRAEKVAAMIADDQGGYMSEEIPITPHRKHVRVGRSILSDESDDEDPPSSPFTPPPQEEDNPQKRMRVEVRSPPQNNSGSRSEIDLQQSRRDEGEVMTALRDISKTLNHLVERVENTESELKKVKYKVNTCFSSTSSSDDTPKKATVPLTVRAETRKMYKTLVDDDDQFTGFDVGQGVTFKDNINQSVVTKLVKEVLAVNPSFQASHVRSAVYTYYKTLSQEESQQRRGKLQGIKKIRRHRERISRKLQQRKIAFQKRSYQPKDKEKWSKVLVPEYMSSEESGEENANNIIIKPLSWRAPRVDSFLRSLDETSKDGKSPQSRRQMKSRVMGEVSERPKPRNAPSWAVM